MQAIDVHVIESGCSYIDKWFVALSLGSGQTRNMALDRFVSFRAQGSDFFFLLALSIFNTVQRTWTDDIKFMCSLKDGIMHADLFLFQAVSCL